ncbi:MAG: SHD1 domain-containing protein [Pirellulaceae bacterium]
MSKLSATRADLLPFRAPSLRNLVFGFAIWLVVSPIVPFALYAPQAIGGEPKGALIGFASQRTWSNDSGAFKIPAKLSFADEKTVKLAKPDGRTVTVPLEKLSESDQLFVRGFLQAEAALKMTPQGETAANPFAGGEPTEAGGGSATLGGGSPSSGLPRANQSGGIAEIPKREVVSKGIRPISISPGREFWEVEKLVGFPSVDFQEIVIPTDVAKPFFAAFRMQAAGRAGNVVMNSYQEKRGNRQAFGKLAVVNSTTGDATPTLDLDAPWKLLAVSPDGKRIAAVRITGFDKGNDVALFRIVGNSIVPEYQFTAGGGSWDELHFVAFLPKNRLMTISQKHNLTIWELPEGDSRLGPRARFRGTSGGKLWAELSPAGDVLAMIAGKSIAFVETEAFKLKGYIPRNEEANHMAFSPDGMTLAAYHPFSITVYSMETGKEIQTFAVSESSPNTKIHWLGEHLLVGEVLYDAKRGVPLWTYTAGKAAKCTLGSFLFCGFGGDKESTLTVYRVPHAEAMRVADEIDPDNIYCIQPGDSVAVDYELPGVPRDVRDQIVASVEAKITELGWQISNASSNQIQIMLEEGERGEAEYYTSRGFGPRFFSPFSRPSGPSEKVSYRPWKHTFTIRSGKEQVYHTVLNRTAPGNLTTKDGESTQQAVNRYCKPYPEYFKRLKIPPHILKPEYQGGLGKSQVTAAGMR